MKTNTDYRLKVENLGKSFTLHQRGGMEVEAFSGISFTLRSGELLALSGPSGAGKSSILKTIFRTYLPRCGSALFRRDDGSEVDLACCDENRVLELRRREIAFVTQFLSVLPRVTALDWVSQPLVETGTALKEAEEQARQLLTRLGIRSQLFNLSPLTFSGGEQQRVNIAHGIIAPKELILLDEPTASLDGKSGDIVLELLDELKKMGIAMVGIFHDRRRLEQIADGEIEVQRQ